MIWKRRDSVTWELRTKTQKEPLKILSTTLGVINLLITAFLLTALTFATSAVHRETGGRGRRKKVRDKGERREGGRGGERSFR